MKFVKLKYLLFQILFSVAGILGPKTALAQVPLNDELRPEYLPDIQGATANEKIFGLAGNLIAAVLQIAGGVTIIFIIIVGFRYILAGGEEEKVGKAKTTLMWVIGGLILLMISYVIVRFVVKISLVTEEV